MAAFPENGVLTGDGTYLKEGLDMGREYLLVFYVSEWSTETIDIEFQIQADGAFGAPENYQFDADRREDRFIAPTGKIQLTVQNYGGSPITATIREILR